MPKFPSIINAVGIELEGGFHRNRRDRSPIGGGDWHGDGSVCMDSNALWAGEAVSEPIKKWSVFAKWVKDNFPNRVNRTCGNHLHISFKNQRNYTALITQKSDILDSLQNTLEEWIRNCPGIRNSERTWMENRLDGDHEYCRKNWTPGDQLSDYGCRYTWLNVQAWNKYKTIEVRVLPAFWSPKRLLSACGVVLDWIGKEARNFDRVHTVSRELDTKLGKRALRDVKVLPAKVPTRELLELMYGDDERAADAFSQNLYRRGIRPESGRTNFPNYRGAWNAEAVEGV